MNEIISALEAARECPYCNRARPVSDFPRRNARCKACRSVYDKSRPHRANPRDPRRNVTENARARKRRWLKEHYDPAKVSARNAVYQALLRGKLTKPAGCEQCGESPRRQDGRSALQAHHHNGYDRPLDVKWLCAPCHKAEHAGEAR